MPVTITGKVGLSEQAGTGDDVTTLFTYTVSTPPIETRAIRVIGNEIFYDPDGSGTLVGSKGGTGTVNYTTGDISVTFATAPPSGMPIFVYYTSTTMRSLTLKVKRIVTAERWRQKSIPIINQSPMIIDLGMEEHTLEIEAMLKSSTDLETYYAFVNPIQVTSSTYPEIDLGYWRMSERRADRRPGWISSWEIRFRLSRDYYYTG